MKTAARYSIYIQDFAHHVVDHVINRLWFVIESLHWRHDDGPCIGDGQHVIKVNRAERCLSGDEH